MKSHIFMAHALCTRSFSSWCNFSSLIHCKACSCYVRVSRRPSSVQTFITLADITTSTGYPLQITGGTRIHLKTLVVFRYRTHNQLCNAAKATNRRDRRQVSDIGGQWGRIRRQTTSDESGMSQDLVTTILAYENKLVRRKVIKHVLAH